MNKEFLQKLLINFFHSIIFVFCFLLIVLFVIKFQKFGLSEDFPWLLTTGKYILSNQAIPKSDIFSWTNNGKDWIVYQWLFEAFIAFVTINFNVNFLLVIFIFITFTSYLFIPLWISHKEKTSFIIPFLIGLISLYVASVNLSVRPTIFTSLFLAIQFLLLKNQNVFKTKRPLFFLLFFLTYAFWANIHLVVFLGFGVLLIELFGALIDRNFNKDLVFVLLSAFTGSLINPYGLKIYQHLFESTTTNVFIHGVNELSAPDFGLLKYQIFLLMSFVFLGLVIYQLISKKKIFKIKELFVLLALSFATFFVQRFVVWFCLFYSLIFPLVIYRFFISINLNKNRFWNSLVKQFDFYKLHILLALFILIFTPFVFAKNTNEYGVCEKIIPSIEKYLSNQRSIQEEYLFNDPLIGSCLLYEYPKVKVYGDTRFDFYGPDFVNVWISALKDEEKFQKLSENEKFSYIFITKEWPLSNYLKSSEKHKKLFEDNETIAFETVIE